MSAYETDHSFKPVVVLSGPTTHEGLPHPDDTLLRIKHGAEIASSTNSSLFAVGGCAAQMRDIAIKQGLHPERTIAFGDLRDTVGNAINVREELVDFLGAQSLWLVTADYHMARASRTFRKVMPEITISEEPSPTTYSNVGNLMQVIKERTVRAAASKYFLKGYDFSDPFSHMTTRSRLENFAATRNKIEGHS